MVYAAKIGAGGLGFLITVLLIVGVVIIGIALSRSLKRLRRSVDDGTFGHPDDIDLTKASQPDDPASRRGPGGASV